MFTQQKERVSDRVEYVKIEHYLYGQLNNCRKKLNKPLSYDEHRQSVQQQTTICCRDHYFRKN